MLLSAVVFLLLFPSLQAQTQNTGIAPEWAVRATLKELIGQAHRYQAAVERLNVEDWIAQGAPQTYQSQRQSVQREAGYLRTVSVRLSEEPEKISLALDAFFRLQSLESNTISLSEGARRYQEGPLSDELNRLVTENADTRFKLRQYVLDLSQTKEQEHAVAVREAQRCQEVLNRNPLAPPPARPARTTTKKDRP